MFYQSILIDTPNKEWGIENLANILPSEFQYLLSDQHPDIFVIKKDTASSIGVEQVKALISWNAQKPYQGEYKMGIIYDAHKLTTEAQNTLLKTLEEPSPNTQLVLITNHVSAILNTIRSRVQLITLDSDVENTEESIEKIAKNFLSPDYLNRLQTAGEIVEKHADKESQLQILTLIMKRLIEKGKLNPDKKKVLNLLETCKTAYSSIKSGGNTKLTWESLAISMD